MARPRASLPIALAVAFALGAVFSALGVIYSKHESRKLFGELERANERRDELNIEWGRLQIEQSTFATHGLVERVAENELALVRPAIKDVYVIEER